MSPFTHLEDKMRNVKRKIYVSNALMVLFTVAFGILFWQWRVGIAGWCLLGALAVFFLLQMVLVHVPVGKADRTLEKLYQKSLEDSGGQDTQTMEINDKMEYVFQYLQESMNREYRAKVLKKQAELNALQSQINPHFLYNTLESIRGEALIEGMDEIADMTEALGNFFRYSISSKGSLVTLEDELNNIQNYYLIQKFRFGERINLKVDMEDRDAIIGFRMPKLIIQPIVENAIFHGLENKIGKGTITISIAVTDQRLVLVISDDGSGIREDKLLEMNERLQKGIDFSERTEDGGSGIALYNVNQRIKLCFGDEYGIHVYSMLDNGTDVVITLPVVDAGQKEITLDEVIHQSRSQENNYGS